MSAEQGDKKRVYVTRRIPQEGIDMLSERYEVKVNPEDRVLTREELLQEVSDVDGVLCLLTDKIDAEVFDAAKRARGFANYAVGYDNIDVKEATRRRVPISNTPGVLTDATAEMAWTLLFTTARRVIEADAHMRSGKWGGWGPMQFLGGDVTGKTLGIVGAGRIGRAVARKSRGFDMDIVYSDVERSEEMEKEYGARKVEFEQLLAQSDFISVHVPLMDQTRHLFDREAFSKMKSSAYLINTSRGPVIKEEDLLEALRSGEIAGAGLDVYEFEPKMTEGLEKLDNVVVTPHIASATTYARTQMGVKAARNLIAMIEGSEPPDCVNPEALR